MLRINPCTSAGQAKNYYLSHLAIGDYLDHSRNGEALWHGKGASLLGLDGKVVDLDSFSSLVDNTHPLASAQAGERLTPRMDRDRIVGWDFNFHVPKSVSLAHGLGGDTRIANAILDAVNETMNEIEQQAATRVRRNGLHENRPTGNFVWASFVHDTARPVNGIQDPHLHVHCFVMNATHDNDEGRWKAAKIRAIKQQAPYFQAAFYTRMASKLASLGYEVVQSGDTRRPRWELAGISEALRRKFSRRTAVIEEEAEARGITHPEAKAELGAKTREAKGTTPTHDALRKAWGTRLDAEEIAAIAGQRDSARRGPRLIEPLDGSAAVAFALAHHFERDAVLSRARVLATALQQRLGSVMPEQAKSALLARADVRHATHGDQAMITTANVLREERAMLAFARDGKASVAAINPAWTVPREAELSVEQASVASMLLASSDRVQLVYGQAGTGKSSMMKTAVAAIREAGHAVTVMAPTTQAAFGVLRQEGFREASTLASFLENAPSLPARQGGKDEVWWLDEAGLVGSRAMATLFRFAALRKARVVLMGDPRQHPPIERGDALRLLIGHAGLEPLQLTAIRRQQGTYRDAVAAFARGRGEEGIGLLLAMNAVRVQDDNGRHAALVEEFMTRSKDGQRTLIVAPTHAEGDTVVQLLRAAQKQEGIIEQQESASLMLRPLGWTAAERGVARQYEPGMVLEFGRHGRGYRAGDRAVVDAVEGDTLQARLRRTGEQISVPLADAPRFDVFSPQHRPLAVGDAIRLTRNVRDVNGRRVRNGTQARLVRQSTGGHWLLDSGILLAADTGHWRYAGVTTSYASQGQTVDHVMVALGRVSLAAASIRQLYVSLSRGRMGCSVYTDSIETLRESAGTSGERLSAVDVDHWVKREGITSARAPKQRLQAWRRYCTLVWEQARHGVSHALLRMRSKAKQREEPSLARWKGGVSHER